MEFPQTYTCYLCQSAASVYEIVDGYPYYRCSLCNFLFLPYTFIGFSYDKHYWEKEHPEALRREQEDCCLRALELIYLSKIPVRKLLDFGCGLGFTVQWIRKTLGIDAYGVDKYGAFEATEYLFKEDLLSSSRFGKESFDAIFSVEVIEHINQDEIVPIFSMLRDILKPGGLLLVNTGMFEYILESEENKGYIDPKIRGHISIFSLKTFQNIADTLGFIHVPMWTRTWSTLLMKPHHEITADFSSSQFLDENYRTIQKANPLIAPLLKRSLWAEELWQIIKAQGSSA